MIEGPNVVNVTGFDNGCAAHCILHAFEDHIFRNNFFNNEKWNTLGCEDLLLTFSNIFGVQNPTPEKLKKALISIQGYANREIVFGPMIRRHMANIIGHDEQYKKRAYPLFLNVIQSYLAGQEQEGTNDNLRMANSFYISQLENEYTRSGLDLDIFIQLHEKEIYEFYFTEGFDNYIQILGNTNAQLLFTVDEICSYAKMMNIDLKLRGTRGDSYQILEMEQYVPEQEKLFSLVLLNRGNHWKYRADYLTEEQRNVRTKNTHIAPEDRKLPEIRAIYEKGWEEGIQAFIPHIQLACGQQPYTQQQSSGSEQSERDIERATLESLSERAKMVEVHFNELFSSDRYQKMSEEEINEHVAAVQYAYDRGDLEEVTLLIESMKNFKP